MPDLIAQGPQSYHRWRREVPTPTSCVDLTIGRSDADWKVPWDPMISRAHVRLIPQPDDRIEIVVVRSARNPVFHQGRQAMRFIVVPGEHFVIGKTTFTLATGSPGASPNAGGESGSDALDVTENVFDHVALRRRHFRDVNSRIDVLTRLPDLIASSHSDQELLVRVTSVLLQSTPSAATVSILSARGLESDPKSHIEVLHYDSRNATQDAAAISRQLVIRAIEKRESVLNLWERHDGDDAVPQFTAREDVDWAFCVPLRTEACRGWVIYITGQTPDLDVGQSPSSVNVSEQLQDDVKFAELVGTTIASLRQSRRLERRQSAMRNFFAPVVMNALASGDTDQVLEPRESDLTVMFCDLRGFSRQSERNAGQLLQLLSNVSDALGVMTKHILGFDGVIGDFHGDAAMGFWGWPLAQLDTALRATGAAMAIRDEYRLSDLGFRCGIGIAHGKAVAGRIGTTDQVKVTAFGPVVNLASRLESMSKMFGAEIIIDAKARESIQSQHQEDAAIVPRFRTLATVRPAGFQGAVTISEVVSTQGTAENELTDELIGLYEAGLQAFQAGDDRGAMELFQRLPTWDGPSEFMLKQLSKGGHEGGIINLPK